MQKIPSFSLLSRLLAFASQVVTATIGKGMCNFRRSGEMLLFCSDNLKAAGSKAGTTSALLFPVPCDIFSPCDAFHPGEVR